MGPSLAVVHFPRSGQARQAAPKMTAFLAVTCRVMPAGQVTVPAAASTVKSSTVKPPSTAGWTGLGLMTAWCPAAVIAARRSPVP